MSREGAQRMSKHLKSSLTPSLVIAVLLLLGIACGGAQAPGPEAAATEGPTVPVAQPRIAYRNSGSCVCPRNRRSGLHSHGHATAGGYRPSHQYAGADDCSAHGADAAAQRPAQTRWADPDGGICRYQGLGPAGLGIHFQRDFLLPALQSVGPVRHRGNQRRYRRFGGKLENQPRRHYLYFRLTDGVEWNDGTPLTVDDVLYTFLRYGNPCNSTGRSGLWRRYANPLEVADRDAGDCTLTNPDDAVRAVDDRTIEFHLAFASGAFIKFLAIDYVKILPKHLLEKDIDLNLAENIIKHNSGSGPFVLEEYQSGNLYYVNKNQNYFKDGLPYVDRIEHYIITTPATAQAQVEARQIDMSNAASINLTAPEYYALEQRTNSEYVAHDVFGGATRGFMLNIKREPFSDHRVRQAITWRWTARSTTNGASTTPGAATAR